MLSSSRLGVENSEACQIRKFLDIHTSLYIYIYTVYDIKYVYIYMYLCLASLLR